MMRGYGPYSGGGMMGGSGGGWLLLALSVVFWVILVVGAVLLTVWAIRSMRLHGHERLHEQASAQATAYAPSAAPMHDEAVAIARRRLASGEITAEQFEEIKKTLDG